MYLKELVCDIDIYDYCAEKCIVCSKNIKKFNPTISKKLDIQKINEKALIWKNDFDIEFRFQRYPTCHIHHKMGVSTPAGAERSIQGPSLF